MKRIYEISIPHFTEHGTFETAIYQLENIAKFGADALYMLPVNPVDLTTSRSPYCITDNFRVREDLGGFEGLKRFNQVAHDLGLKVILDVVLNHASINHYCAFDKDFFDLDENKKPFHPIGTDWTDVYQVNHRDVWYSCNSLYAMYHFIELGIDGFRFDATSFLPDHNLISWLSGLIQKKPDVILWSDSKSIEKDIHPFTHVSAPIGQPEFDEPRSAIQIASLGSHDLLRNEGSLREVYGEDVAAIQEKLIQQSAAFLFPMGSEKGFDNKYDFYL